LFKDYIEKGMKKYDPPLEGRSERDLKGRPFLLLDFNEGTVPPPKKIRKVLGIYINAGELQLYPEYGDTDQVIATYAGVGKNQVIFTVGADQGIDIISRGIVEKGDKVIITEPTFDMFDQSAKLEGAKIVAPRYVESGDDFSFPLEEVLDTIDKDTRLVVVCNPNNPTGTIVSKENVEKVIKRANEFDSAVMVDEAYHEFNQEISVKDLVDRYNNLFITRSFSKVGRIASLRPGYVISQEYNIEQLNKIRGPYDPNSLASIAVRCFKYKDTVREMMGYIREVMEEAKPATERFFKENGIKAYKSGSNFILVNPSPFYSKDIYSFLESYANEKYRGIRVRMKRDPPNTFRVTIGTKKNMNYFMEAFRGFLDSKKGG
jgi:histidinol-phosphate aminotransferase